MKKILLFSLSLLCSLLAGAVDTPRWDIHDHYSIQWKGLRGGVPHHDHIEMSGERVSVVYYWGVNEKKAFEVRRSVVFPMLRTVPNNTHASLTISFEDDFLRELTVNGRRIEQETVEQVTLDGTLQVCSRLRAGGRELRLHRILFPSPTEAAVCEHYSIYNDSDEEMELSLPSYHRRRTTDAERGTRGSYALVAKTEFDEDRHIRIKPKTSYTFCTSIQGYAPRDEKEISLDVPLQLQRRQQFVEEVTSQMEFQCPDDTLNTMFALAKIRASESIFRTKGGLMHSPGGESYYAAVWCNDQCEYVNPFFPFLGYALGNEQAMNVWRMYARYTNPEYKFVPWSIICEGEDTFGPFDRGDAAMIAYGCGRYALEYGDRKAAQEVWPLITWCLEYCHRQLNEAGVVRSDADELEHRLPAGTANLCTSSLYYDALLSAAYLSKELGEPVSVTNTYRKEAENLRKAIAKYFHATIDGYDTYRYYEGNDVLRSWICIPLTMGIFDRVEGTIQAMFSPQLWTENGMLSAAGDKIFWDRSTLYGFRGALAAGHTEQSMKYLKAFSAHRLLGEHVPYVVEAWPEGNQRHLSAENGLYCRIFSEGLLGFRPTGLRSFTLTPQMPDDWNRYRFRNVHACSPHPYDITVERKGQKLEVSIGRQGQTLQRLTTRPGQTIRVKLP